ncbi:MAG: galactosyldiacylglycerol synthase [Chloroflexi bacterium HGW-Chloroflexi-10]|nr:MAG: galactosyldiacylglycerol synthase [Chloroflexi bacterium HGW-Chloroflexi-10]
MKNKPKILFLFSDTGGGHRSAAEAIIEALNLEFPDVFETEMVDIFREYAPSPLNFAPEIYPYLSRMPRLWEVGYKISDGPRRTRVFYDAIWPYLRRSLRKLLKEKPVDLIVSVHQLVNTPVLRARLNADTRFVTVVTDLVSTHAAWYHPGADMVIVPTIPAREKALKNGLPDRKIRVIGQPVADRYTQPQKPQSVLREKFGWRMNLPIVLMVGGGEGMGPLEKHAYAIDQAHLPIQMIIIAGRNKNLKDSLESYNWQTAVKIYGFVREMPEFMHASNVLITKAGPGTISEAFIAGLPLILYSKMPGQEDGNVGYVVNQGAGIWAPEPEKLVEGLRMWIENPTLIQSVAAKSKQLARPLATREIAKALAEQIPSINYHSKQIEV